MAPKPATILVVDDQTGARYTLVRMLQRAQYVVKEAGNGADALRLAAEKPDLIILDVGLPDVSGYEVCRKIKADPATASIPVLHLSASFAESENRVRGLEGGADGYLTYPVEPPELLANVQALLRVREAERQAREQREILLVTLNSIGDGVIATDTEARVTFINPVAQALIGCKQEETLGRPLGDVFRIVHSGTGQPVDNPVDRVIREGVTVGLADRTVLIAKDGARRAIDDTAAPIRDDQGTLVGVVLIFRDVSQRRQAEQAVQESTRRLRFAMEASGTGMWDWDLRTNIVTWSPECYAIYGVQDGEFDGTQAGVDRLLHPEDRERVWTEIRKAAAQRSTYTGEFRFIRPSSEVRWAAARGRADYDEQGRPERMIGTLIDITERKHAERALRDEARRKDEFLAMLGHELRNPLAPIRNAIQIIRHAGTHNPAVERAGEMVERQVQHMTRLVDDLLDVSRVSRGKIELRKEKVDLAAIIVRAIENARPLIDARKHELILELPPRPIQLEGDPTRLVQVLGNLLTNAAKYTDPGGRIWLTAERQGEWAMLRVRDTGIGIRPEVLPHIFDLFVQADRALDRAAGGLGIGLTLVRSLVEMHGGTARAVSEGPGRGSEFSIRLPVLPEADDAVEHEPSSGRAQHIPPTPRRRVLVVDDNVDAAVSLAMLLQMQRHEVNVAHDGEEALEAVRRYRPEIVLLDIGLPAMDGYEVARRLRQEHGKDNLVLVAMTGYGQDEDRRRSHEAGFNAHLVKPADLTVLQEILTGNRPSASGQGEAD